jgi:hypothetical protein
MTRPPRSLPIRPALAALPAHPPQRQLTIVFESPGLQGMTPTERTSAVSALAMLLMQAAGVQLPGAHDEKH